MDATPAEHLVEPSAFSKCSLNWTIRPAGADSSITSCFVCSDTQFSSQCVIQHQPQQYYHNVKNRYGDVLFKIVSVAHRYFKVSVMSADQKRLATIKERELDLEVSQTYFVSVEKGNFIFLHGPYQGKHNPDDEIEKSQPKPLVKYLWEKNCLRINQVEESSEKSDSVLVAIILAKGFQLMMYYRGKGKLSFDHGDQKFAWNSLREYATDVLSTLRYTCNSLLLFKREKIGPTWHHYLETHKKQLMLVLEYNEETKYLVVRNSMGILQFYAQMNFAGASSTIHLHPRVPIGKIQHDNLVYKYDEIVLKGRSLNSQKDVGYEIIDAKCCTVGKLVSGERGVEINISPEVSADRKAMILTYLFREAWKNNVFRSATQPDQDLSHLDRSLYCCNRSLFLYVQCPLMRLENLGGDDTGAISYYGVVDADLNPGKHFCIFFGVDERPGNVQAVAHDYNSLQIFSISGLWDMKADLVVSAGSVIGLNRADTFYDCAGTAVFHVEKQVDPNWSEVFRIYRKIPIPGEHPQVAQIFGNKSIMYIQLPHLNQLDGNQKALVISYALKISYNMYRMYTTPVKVIDFPRNKDFARVTTSQTELVKQTQEMKIE